jgi:hypothetical protein
MMRRPDVERIALGLLAVAALPIGIQAALAPRSFFDDFPFGRSWIAHERSSYDEHLVRDVGALFLAMAIVTGWTAIRRLPSRPIAVAWLVQGILHFIYHASNLHGLGTPDRIGLVGSLASVPVLAVVALWAGRPIDARGPID